MLLCAPVNTNVLNYCQMFTFLLPDHCRFLHYQLCSKMLSSYNNLFCHYVIKWGCVVRKFLDKICQWVLFILLTYASSSCDSEISPLLPPWRICWFLITPPGDEENQNDEIQYNPKKNYTFKALL